MKAIFGAVFVLAAISDATVLIADHGMSKMIELTTKAPFCHVHTDRGRIRQMVFGSDPRRVRQMSDGAISKLEEVCKTNQVHSAHQGGFIYPGTKWCGPGNVAKNYTDLGYHKKEDMCCREHDHCPHSLSAKQCLQGICNTSPFTRSHCDCDAKFRRCLQNVNTETANTIGAIFFNIVQVICFKERSPCSQWQNSTKVTDDLANETDPDTLLGCDLEFQPSERYKASVVRRFQWKDSKAFIVNLFLRKFKLLQNGYTKAESDKLCSQWKYRPSEKYIPLMPVTDH